MRFSVLATTAVLALSGPALAAGENVSGKWSAVYQLPLVPSSGAVLPNGKVLLWSADGEFSFSSVGRVYTTVFDPADGSNAAKRVDIGHNMFCTGTTNLPDGRILVNGGSNAAVTSIYDPATGEFKRVQNMNLARGYNANTILQDGSVFTLGGSWSGTAGGPRDGEIWTEASGWRRLTGVTTATMRGVDANNNSFAPDSHMWLIPGGNGRVFFAGPAPAMQWIDTNGAGAVTSAGPRGDDAFAVSGIAVMYDKGKILKAGGSPSYDRITASAASYLIDIDRRTTVTKLAPMAYGRTYHNAVVLPDGKVLVVGGQSYAAQFTDSDSVMATELWDPATARFTVTAPISVPRNYHSIAMLLPDGRVLSGGGGLCGTCTGNHPDVQIYSPPYLFDAAGNLKARPAITGAPSDLAYGRSVTVTTDRDVASFALVRVGSTTHTVNNDQRRLPLAFSRTGTNTFSVQIPSNAGYLLPGQWMLFALDSSGTPSVARMVRVSTNAIAMLTAPDTVVAAVGRSVSVQPVVRVVGTGVTFGGTGLPPGLSIDPATGRLAGTPTAVGTYAATLTATNATGTVSTDFTVTVDPAGTGTGLLADYFPNRTVSGTPVLTRRETPFFDFGTAGPGSPVASTNFSARWSGQLLAQRTGTTRFRTVSDDGVRLWIGGRLLVDDWTDHAARTAESQIDLVAGQSYPVLLEYNNGGGPGVMQLSWQRPGDTGFTAIPVAQFSAPAALPSTNLARGKTASQSSTYNSAAASRAVDGNTNGSMTAGSVNHTNSQANAWWQVDLGASFAIDRVRLWNRTDCCGTRLQNVQVMLSETSMSGRTYAALMADPAVVKRTFGASAIPSNIDIQGAAPARYVRVQLAGTNYLHLAEVEVFGTAANRAPGITPPASQISGAGTPVSLQIAASDPDGDALAYSATGLPPGLAINAATGLIGGTPTTGGSYAATVSVRDPGGLSASAPLSWTVSVSMPSVTRLDVSPAVAGSSVAYAPVIANGTGASYRWSFGDGTAETAFTASPNRTKVFAQPGIYGVTLTLQAADGRQTNYRFDQTVTAPAVAGGGGSSSSGLAVENRPGLAPRLFVANPDNDSVGVVDLSTNARVAEVAVGRKPVSVGIAPNGSIWAVNRESATISVISPTTLTVTQTIALPRASRPHGLIFIPSAQSAIVTLEATEQVARIYLNGGFGGALTIGPSPRFLAVNGAGDRVWISRFVTPPLPGESTATVRTVDAGGKPVGGEIVVVTLNGAVERTVVLRHSEAADTEVSARGIPNYLGAPAFSPDGRSAWVPSKQDNVKRGVLRDGQGLDFQTSVRAIVSRIDVATGQEDLASRVDLDNAGVASAALFHPNGSWLFVALQTSREVAVVDPVGKRELFRFAVGRAPSSLALSADGRTLYVGNFMDRSVSVVSLAPLMTAGQKAVTVLATVPTIGTEKMPAAVVQGKKLFYDAADPRLARDGYLSCASCHDDAEGDGRTWDFTGFGEGLRSTISLQGRGGTAHGFLHWSANFDEIQDFEGQIRAFAGGEGLMTNAAFSAGTRSQPLGDRKAGQSADLDALAAYLASRTAVPESPWRNSNGSLTTAGVAGKAVFDRLGCATCHAGAKMTVSADASALKSVGTITATSGKRLGGPLTGLDVPTLLGAFATAPYLHDGRAATLEAAVAAHQGVTVTSADMANLVAYLRQIGPTP